MSAANRRRGADAERAVVAYLRANGYPDARRYLAGDGRQPGDIDAIPGVAIEVKDRAASSWPSWCAQAVAEANGRIPVVVRRTRGVPDVGQWETRVRLLDWLDPSLLDGPELEPNHFAHCPRTGEPWVQTTFLTLCQLVREDVA